MTGPAKESPASDQGLPRALDLSGLTPRPPQSWGGVRLVPLVRRRPVSGIRLDARAVGETIAVSTRERNTLIGYVPHAYIATWTSDGSPAASYGTQLLRPQSEPHVAELGLRRLVQRKRRKPREDQAQNRVRFLPLALALDGLLGLEFGGSDIAWRYLSRAALRNGLSPRVEVSISGYAVPGLEEALRVFEIEDGQSGVLVYVADQLVSAFVTPHPADYRALHASLVLDQFGDVFYEPGFQHAAPHGADSRLGTRLPDVDSLAELRAALTAATDTWASGASGSWLGPDLFGVLMFDDMYQMGPFTLTRFLSSFTLDEPNHLGEAIVDDEGAVAYLHTYRLSGKQVRTGRLLSALREAEWNLPEVARVLDTDTDGVLRELAAIGLEGIVGRAVLAGWQARQRRLG